MKIQLQHQASGLIREVPLGFSWTALFFGFWVPLFRGDFVWCALCLVIDSLSVGLFWLVFPFIYNKIFIRKQLERGYQPANENARGLLIRHKIIAPNWRAPNSRAPDPMPDFSGMSTMTPALSKSDFSAQDQNATASDPLVDLAAIIETVMRTHHNAKKAYTDVTLPPELRDVIARKFAPINLRSEKLLLAAIYRQKFIIKGPVIGIVLTDQNLYYRVISGFLSSAKSGSVAWSAINSLAAEHVFIHSTYGGGIPGPEISINGKVLGWIPVRFTMDEADEKFIIDLFKRLNEAGFFLRMRR